MTRTKRSTSHSTPVLTVCAALCTWLFLLGFGLLICCAPATTTLLAQATVDDARSPYTHDQLVESSIALRNLTVDGADSRNAEGIDNETQMYALIGRNVLTIPDAELATAGVSAAEIASITDDEQRGRFVSDRSDELGLPADALQHLNDVTAVMRWALPLFWIAGLVAVAADIALLRMNRGAFRRALRFAPLATAALFVALGIWGAVDFMGLFSVFHNLLFPQGNWTFYIDSLLICSLPTDFWMGMAGIWLVCTLAACIICLLISKRAGTTTAK